MQNRDYQKVEKAIGYLLTHYQQQPPLSEVAAYVHQSPYHFNRLFKAWAGITPKQFCRHLSLRAAKRELQGQASILSTASTVGLSGPSRLHDLFVDIEAVTPGEYKRLGQGLRIGHGLAATRFGLCFFAWTQRGLLRIAFAEGPAVTAELEAVRAMWPKAILEQDQAAADGWVQTVFGPPDRHCRIVLSGTNFQHQVWRALLRVPAGHTISYQQLALCLGRPKATRAVASAVAANSLAYVIPCHRVIRASGALGQYRWGSQRKQALLAWEQAQGAAAGEAA